MSRDGRTAVMRFRKRYQITGGPASRSGEVLQELRWRRTEGGWRIVSERDLRAIYRYVRHLGPAGKPAPAYLPPGQTPPLPYMELKVPPGPHSIEVRSG